MADADDVKSALEIFVNLLLEQGVITTDMIDEYSRRLSHHYLAPTPALKREYERFSSGNGTGAGTDTI